MHDKRDREQRQQSLKKLTVEDLEQIVGGFALLADDYDDKKSKKKDKTYVVEP